MEEKELQSLRRKAKKLKQQLERYDAFMEIFEYVRKNIFILNPIILDVETTGIRREDEILQLSIIDLGSNIVFDKYTKPKKVNEWDEAFKIHNISKEMVENKKNISYYKRDIEKILKKHKLIIGYEVNSDIAFLKRSGIELKSNIVLDIAYLFSLLFENENLIDRKIRPSLSEAAKYYNFDFNAHDALSDCIATLHCFKSILVEKREKLVFKYDNEAMKFLEQEEKIEEKEYKEDKLVKLAKKYIKIFESIGNKIVLDLETTGIRENDEIIQLSIIDSDGNNLLNEYFKPINVTEWEDAYKIHKISREMLYDKPSIEDFREEIQKILDMTDYMIGYGIDFDYKLLIRHGFNVEHIRKVDISDYFKYLYRKILNDPKLKRPKLIECSSYYGFKEDDFHNSLTDCYATLLSYKGIYKDMLEELSDVDEGKNN
ncbi:3'-5' exonuclease [Streptobacillus felis]|uniref:3'-5' exonuclease n=2 Tax=Streptobacillus felis TaxID=1384509 RepID=A0A7Z0PF65_9FUSO|nr:3'-5' exonuclease [Streptobacillus felis]NYV27661.1 3'-5' exonuclease [Streptobacillus felis]